MSARTPAILIAALAGVFVALHKLALAQATQQADAAAGGPTGGDPMPAGGVLGPSDIMNLATDALSMAGVSDVTPQMLAAIAEIESSGDPTAVRVETAINDASAGLCQTLISTAQWLAGSMGYQAFGMPALSDLLQPQESLYFGAAYLHYLRNYGGQQRPDEWVVRAYNGGPGGADAAATAPYYTRWATVMQQNGWA